MIKKNSRYHAIAMSSFIIHPLLLFFCTSIISIAHCTTSILLENDNSVVCDVMNVFERVCVRFQNRMKSGRKEAAPKYSSYYHTIL